MEPLLAIIHEDDDLLVVNKPAGLVCHPTKGNAYSSLISRVRLHLGSGSAPRLINRLDRETSGVVVVGKNAEAAGELGRLWESREVAKEYQAIVHGHLREDQGRIDAPLGKDDSSRVAIKNCVRADGQQAQTEYAVVRRFARRIGATPKPDSDSPSSALRPPASEFTLVRVLPRSGRKHQIRIHLAHIGHPIVGDKLYGGDEDLYLALVEDRLTDEQRARLILPFQALHAETVRMEWRSRQWEFSCEPEPWFADMARSDGCAGSGAPPPIRHASRNDG